MNFRVFNGFNTVVVGIILGIGCCVDIFEGD